MRKGRLFLGLFLTLGTVAVASVLPPYQTLWSLLPERHLEPSGKAAWQLRSEQDALAKAKQQKEQSEKERLAAIQAEEERKRREKSEAEKAAALLAQKRAAFEGEDAAYERLAISLGQYLSVPPKIQQQFGKRLTSATNAMAAVERNIGSFLQAILLETDMSIARVMAGEACRRAANPVMGAFDTAYDTVLYIILCMHQKVEDNADPVTRAMLGLYLNRSRAHASPGLNGFAIDLPALMAAAWMAKLSLPAYRYSPPRFSNDMARSVEMLFESEAPSFLKRIVVDSITTSELNEIRERVIPGLISYIEERKRYADLCSGISDKNRAVQEREKEVIALFPTELQHKRLRRSIQEDVTEDGDAWGDAPRLDPVAVEALEYCYKLRN